MTQLKIKIDKNTLFSSRLCESQNAGKNCAISIAVRDIFPRAWVGSLSIAPFGRFGGLLPDIRILLPAEARQFICQFDNAQPEERLLLPELEFTIDIPDAVLEHIDISELMPLLENHPTLELIHA